MSTFPLLVEEDSLEATGSVPVAPSAISRLCSNFRKYALFGYFTPLMRRAKEFGSTSVRPDLLPELWPSDDLATWSDRFNSFASESQRQSGGKSHLISTLYRTFWIQFIGILLIKIVATLLSLWSIVLMSRFLAWQEKSPGTASIAERNKGLFAGLGILAVELLDIIGGEMGTVPQENGTFRRFAGAQCNFWAQRVGLRVQGVLAAGLFKRVITAPEVSMQSDLAVSKGSKASAYNLLMIDVPSIAEFIFAFVDLVVLPIRVALSFQLLRYQVGASAMAGLLCLVCLVIVILGLEIQSGYQKSPYLRHRDARLSRAHQTMAEIRSLRMIGWEAIAEESINDARKQEIKIRKQRMYLDALAAAVANGACELSTIIVALTQIAIFMAYVIWGLQSSANFVFKASVAIPVMQVVGRLVGPLTNFPFIINSLIEGYISLERYEEYVFSHAVHGRASSESYHPSTDTTLLLPSNSTMNPLIEIDLEVTDEKLVYIQDGVFNWVRSPVDHDEEFLMEERLAPDYIALGESGATIMSPLSAGLPECQPSSLRQQHLFGDSSTFIPADGATATETPFRDPRFSLRVPLLHIKAGECVAVIGCAGSGKSSLLLALLGEMKKVSGVVKLTRSPQGFLINDNRAEHGLSSIGYASQIPWLPGGTVRSTILLDRLFIQERYDKVTDACQLQQDFDSWPEGDNRIISEGAANLSGGQRCRVALARAVYGHPDDVHGGTKVFLLDDPFASVDPRVGATIFKKLFGQNGLLKNAAVVLTIDEASLQCFLDSIALSNERLDVNLKMQIMGKGYLSDIDHHPVSLFGATDNQRTVRPLAIHKKDSLLWEATDVISPSRFDDGQQQSTFIEQAYSGEVGMKTYWWYSRHVGYFILGLMMTFIITLHVSGISSDFWIAHWTAMAPEEKPQVPPTLPPKTVKTEVNPTIRHSGEPDDSPHTHRSFLELEGRKAAGQKHVAQHPLEPLEVLDGGEDGGVEDGVPSLLELSNFKSFHLLSTNSAKTEKDEINMSALSIFVALSLVATAAVMCLYLVATSGAVSAAVSVHRKLLHSMMNAPFWLYDFLPIGVSINRFSADTEVVDGGPLFSMSYFFGSCVHVIITVVALCALSPWCSPLVPVVALAVYYLVYSLYRPTCREFQRSKLLALSPLCGNLSEAESGVVVIRALGAEDAYRKKNLHLTTNLLKAQFVQVGSNSWATTRLQLLAFPFTIINSVVPVYLRLLGLSAGAGALQSLFHERKGSQMAGFIGLAISFALALPTAIGGVVWSISLMEQKMCSVQRVKEIVGELGSPIESENGDVGLIDDSPERVLQSIEDLPPRTGIQLREVEVCYQKLQNQSLGLDALRTEEERFARENLPPALIDVTVEAKPGEHIGVVGRTGSGKSTLLLALLNLVPVSNGSISIDGMPLSLISKALLHRIIGVLPQMPVLRPGWTVRKLLDPKGALTNPAIFFSALQSVGLLKTINAFPLGLDTVIVSDHSDIRSNEPTAARQLSDTQLRLLSLARLALHANQYRLVLIDEPPTKQLATSLNTKKEDKEAVGHPIAGEKGATSDVSETEEGSVIDSEGTQDDDEIDISDLLKTVFPSATVIIAAHHASTLKKCDSIWVMSKGKLVACCEASSIVSSQETLMGIIEAHEQRKEGT